MRAYAGSPFHFAPVGDDISLNGEIDLQLTADVWTWYHFKIEVETAEPHTAIRGKVWDEADPEPADWQTIAFTPIDPLDFVAGGTRMFEHRKSPIQIGGLALRVRIAMAAIGVEIADEDRDS